MSEAFATESAAPETRRGSSDAASRRWPPRISAEDLGWLGLIAAVPLLGVGFVLLAPALAHLYPHPGIHVFRVWRVAIAPEEQEDVRSILALAAPFVIAAIVLARGSRDSPRPSLDMAIIAAQAVAFAALVWAVLEQSSGGPLLAPDYFDPLLLSVPNLVAGTCIGLVMTACLLRPPRLRLPATILRSAEWPRGRSWLALAIAGIATVIWLLPAVITDSTLARSGYLASTHATVFGEDFWAVLNGRTPPADYIAQYANLLPYLVAPVLGAFDSTITPYSIAMCVLSAVGMLAIFGVFSEVTRRRWTALALYVPWVALAAFPWNDTGPYREFDGTYYGVLPERYLGPFLLACLAARSVRRPIPPFLLFGAAGLVVLNNVEFGEAAVLGLIVSLIAAWDRSEPTGRRLISMGWQAVGGLLAALALVSVITLIRAGELPDLGLLTYFNRLFLRDAYGLTPMPSLGLHWALYATYVAALVLAAVRFVRQNQNRTLTAMLAYSGAFGLASGMYFVGRSDQFKLMLLFPAWGLALALVAWTAAGSLLAARGDRMRLRRLLLPGLAAMIGFGVMVSAIDRVPPPWRQVSRISAGGQPIVTERMEGYVQYVRSHTRVGEDVLIIGAPPEHRVADLAGVINVSPLNGVTTLISPAEANRALDQLEDAGGTQVFDRVSGIPESVPFGFAVPEFAAILAARGYRLIDEQPGTHLRLWRRPAS